ncbi:AAA family ATPase [Paraburkholderia sp. JPY419]|uniref:AAA family ATPase n=1 Tax=Paraburkholderia sp. JPY419 TaxID=667660 RepID=UPI003D20D5A9
MNAERDVPGSIDAATYANLIEHSGNRREQLANSEAKAAKAREAKSDAAVAADAKRNEAAVELLPFSEVKAVKIEWLWPDFLPRGKLTLLAGASGAFKTTCALDWAATLSRGGAWPDGTLCDKPRDVVTWSGEDNIADTLAPRLIAAGADLSRVFYVKAKTVDGKATSFDPARDMLQLEAAMAGHDVGMVIIDPLLSAISGDMHRANEVRMGLQPLLDMGERTNANITGITHFSKGSKGQRVVDRFIGSQAFGAVPRMTIAFAHNPETGSHVMARSKTNIAPEWGGFAFTVEQVIVKGDIPTQRINWGGYLNMSPEDIVAAVDAEVQEKLVEQAEHENFLKGILADGPKRTTDVKKEVMGAGHEWKDITRAQKALGVIVYKQPGVKDGPWFWRMP